MYQMYIDMALNEALDATRAELRKTLIPMLAPTVMVILAFALTVYIIGYIFQSAGLHSIAKRRGRRNPWLAWLPVGRTRVLGDISDHYQFACNEKLQGWNTLLVKLQMGQWALVGAYCMMIESFVTNTLTAELLAALRVEAEKKVWLNTHNPDLQRQWKEVLEGIIARQNSIQLQIILPLVIALAVLVGIVVIKVFFYKAQYDVFASSRPEQKVVFLVLGILFPVTIPFFVFACRKYDLGLQKQPPAAETPGSWDTSEIFVSDPS